MKKINIIKTEPHKCYWINQKDEPCSWNSILPEKNFCKRHGIYEGIYTKEDIEKLGKCSGCKNRFMPDSEIKKAKIKLIAHLMSLVSFNLLILKFRGAHNEIPFEVHYQASWSCNPCPATHRISAKLSQLE